MEGKEGEGLKGLRIPFLVQQNGRGEEGFGGKTWANFVKEYNIS